MTILYSLFDIFYQSAARIRRSGGGFFHFFIMIKWSGRFFDLFVSVFITVRSGIALDFFIFVRKRNFLSKDKET